MYRQGDLLVLKIDQIPEMDSRDIVPDGVLLRGEVTGHSHKLVGGSVYKKGNNIYLVLKEKGSLVHEEHGTIELEPGKYAVQRQREYVSKDEERKIYD